MLQIINSHETNKWNTIVKSFKNYDVHYLCEYSRAFELSGHGEALLFYYESNEVRAINVVFKRDISKIDLFRGALETNTFFDLSSPYGYGGFLYEGLDYKKVNQAYIDYCYDNSIVCEFVRFNLLEDSSNKYYGEVDKKSLNIIRDLSLSDEIIFMDFEHKARKSIKKALRNNIEIIIEDRLIYFDEFFEIYKSTMVRNNAKEDYYFKKDFFEELHEMKDHFFYAHALYEGKLISSELVLYSSRNSYSFLGGTNSNYLNLNANSLLKFEIIKKSKDLGLENYILGGGYYEDDGIYKYKKSFSPNYIANFQIGKKIFNEKIYDELTKIRAKRNLKPINSEYFPIYRS